MSISTIQSITALEILDSRGNPTLQVDVTLDNGIVASASVPSGASTGVHEALELRDGDKKRYGGKGVLQAVNNVNTTIAPKLIGLNPNQQRQIDQLMIDLDGTSNKSTLGANAILGVSLAVAKAGAMANGLPLYRHIRKVYRLPYQGYKLPIPTMNVLNGGAHADWVLDFQEYMIVPMQKTFKERVRCGSEVFHALGTILKKQGYSILKGDEGGYAPALGSNEKALQVLMQAIKEAKYVAGNDVMLAMDPAASEFYDTSKKVYDMKVDKQKRTSAQMIELWQALVTKYPLISIEDGLAEDDWDSWETLTKKLGHKIKIVGDDFFVTNVTRLHQGIKRKAANAILIKLNQIGSLSETIDAIELAHKNGFATSISHRSGETSDTTIADLAVAVNSEFIKSGSLARSERTAKYNRLLEIEAELARHGS